MVSAAQFALDEGGVGLEHLMSVVDDGVGQETRLPGDGQECETLKDCFDSCHHSLGGAPFGGV